ncbi:MAG: outer membrane protein assembly factor BamD, partial [Spirochaetaceae bacterium]|nr:outer membrane protein assembly factor BamD [Spirochaetaceae bacterium]
MRRRIRNIRSALEYYRKLIQEYPQSQYSPEAQRRIAYLERYYFN